MHGSLQGLKVLDLTRVLAGPWATQLLGDYGADVVKIERPGAGDDTRHWGPPWISGDGGDAAYFLAANRNKRSLTVDLSTERGQSLIRELAASADVLIENFRSGTMANFGLDHATLAALNPKLIYCSITAYDSQSSRAGQPGYDAMVQASAGLMSITGAPDSEGGGPQKVGVAIADIMTGMYAGSAILAALHHRTQHGGGQYIEVPLYDAQVAWLANQAMNYLVGGELPGRLGNAHPNIVPYQSFATRDSHLMLAVGNDGQFRRCMACLGLDDLATAPRYADNAARVAHRDELTAVLAERFAQQDTADWLRQLRAAEVPCGPINDLQAVFNDPYVHEQGVVRHQVHPKHDALATVANPVRFSETPVSYDQAPPLLGEHSDAVLRDWLGYSADSIRQLRDAGAI